MSKDRPISNKKIIDLAASVTGVAVKRDTNSTTDEAMRSENLRLCLEHDKKLQKYSSKTEMHSKTENTKRLELALNFLKLPVMIGAGLFLENQFQVISLISKFLRFLGL